MARHEKDPHEFVEGIIIGSLIGGIIGAAAGLFLAPKSGEELRQDVSDACSEFCDSTQDLAEDLTKKGRNYAKCACNKSKKWINGVKTIVCDLTESVQETGHDVIDRAKDFKNDRIDDAIELATLGVQLWKKFRK